MYLKGGLLSYQPLFYTKLTVKYSVVCICRKPNLLVLFGLASEVPPLNNQMARETMPAWGIDTHRDRLPRGFA